MREYCRGSPVQMCSSARRRCQRFFFRERPRAVMETSVWHAEEDASTTSRKRPQSAGHEGADQNLSVEDRAPVNAYEENGGDGLDINRGSLCPPPSKRVTTGNEASEEENGSSSEHSELEEHAPENQTVKANRWAVNHFHRWLEDHNVHHPEDPVPVDLLKRHREPELLNKWLARFADEARRLDGKPYPATSVYFLLAALARQMRIDDPTSPNFLTSSNIQFKPLHDSLEGTFRRLKEEVPNEPKNQPPPLSHEEEERLWSSGSLSCNSPKGLVRAIYFLNVKHIGLVGGTKHRLLKLSQFKRINNPPCYMYSYAEPAVSIVEKGGNSSTSAWARKKSDSSSPSSLVKTVTLNAAPEKGARCYVHVLDTYLQRLPQEAFAKDTFYLQPLGHTLTNAPHVWYSLNPMGKNALSKLVREICSDAGITGPRNMRAIKNRRDIEPSVVATTGVSPQQGSMVLSPQIVIPPLSFLMQGAMQVPPLASPTETPTTPVNWGGEVNLASLTSHLSQKINHQLTAIAPKPPSSSGGQHGLTVRRQSSTPVNTVPAPSNNAQGHVVTQQEIVTPTTTSTSTTTNSTRNSLPHTHTQPHQQPPSNRTLPPQSLPIHRSMQTVQPNAPRSSQQKSPDKGKSTTPQGDSTHQQTSTSQPSVEAHTPTKQQETQSIHLPPPVSGATQQLTFNNCHVTIYLTPLPQPPNP